MDPVSPMAMAQTYSLMATLGNASPLGPGIKILGETPADSPVDRKRVSVKPAVLFLINYLLQGLDTAEVKDGGPGKSWEEPALFTARDKEGLWKIAYRSDALLVVRIPGSRFDGSKIEELLDKLLPKTGARYRRASGCPGRDCIQKDLCSVRLACHLHLPPRHP